MHCGSLPLAGTFGSLRITRRSRAQPMRQLSAATDLRSLNGRCSLSHCVGFLRTGHREEIRENVDGMRHCTEAIFPACE